MSSLRLAAMSLVAGLAGGVIAVVRGVVQGSQWRESVGAGVLIGLILMVIYPVIFRTLQERDRRASESVSEDGTDLEQGPGTSPHESDR